MTEEDRREVVTAVQRLIEAHSRTWRPVDDNETPLEYAKAMASLVLEQYVLPPSMIREPHRTGRE